MNFLCAFSWLIFLIRVISATCVNLHLKNSSGEIRDTRYEIRIFHYSLIPAHQLRAARIRVGECKIFKYFRIFSNVLHNFSNISPKFSNIFERFRIFSNVFERFCLAYFNNLRIWCENPAPKTPSHLQKKSSRKTHFQSLRKLATAKKSRKVHPDYTLL